MSSELLLGSQVVRRQPSEHPSQPERLTSERASEGHGQGHASEWGAGACFHQVCLMIQHTEHRDKGTEGWMNRSGVKRRLGSDGLAGCKAPATLERALHFLKPWLSHLSNEGEKNSASLELQ